MARSYAEAGVDISAGDDFVRFVRDSNRTRGSETTMQGVESGFASAFSVDCSSYTHPVVLTTTDGVGTKILLAKRLNDYSTIGLDLVAMCVNDLVVHGARPIDFLDYIACGTIDRSRLDPVISGIIEGCEIAGCRLAGGETAEMPDAYDASDIDLAGFAVGVAEKERLLPLRSEVALGAKIFGLASSGIHSNGLSLARSLLPEGDTEIAKELLIPTKIYVSEVMRLIERGSVVAAAHITGGGILANIERVIPEGLRPSITFAWERPPVFESIRRLGDLDEDEMRSVFNLGVGMALVVRAGEEEKFLDGAETLGIECFEIGIVERG